MKKGVVKALLVAMSLTLAACGSSTSTTKGSSNAPTENKTENKAPKQWAMGTSSSGSSPYVLGGAISKLMNEKQKTIKLSPQVTGGYEENISLISKGTVHVAQATLDQLNDAYAGKGRYQGEAKTEMRALFNAALMPLHLAVLDESSIKSDQDLKGKKVNVASPKQATYTLAVKYLESLGLSINDVTPGSLSTKDAPGGLKDKQQDAIFLASTLPLPGLVEVAVSKPIRLIPIEGKLADSYIEKMEGSLIKAKIPANTYNGVKQDVNTVASPISLYVNQNASEEEVYQFTKTFWDNLNDFHKEFPAGASTVKEIALQGIKVPLHPGAEKYFKEIGLIK
jgi:TRAP transporter TAXI family solute receptor